VTQPDPVERLSTAPSFPTSSSPADASRAVALSPSAYASHTPAPGPVAAAPPLTGRPLRGRGEPIRTATEPSAPLQPVAVPRNSALTSRHPDEPAAMPANVAESVSARTSTRMPESHVAPSLHPSVRVHGFPTAPESEIELSHLNAPSRLSGLRNLLIALGLRSLRREAELRGYETESGSRPERGPTRPVNADRYPSAPDANDGTDGILSTRLTSSPEFLRPKPTAEAGREKAPLRVTPVPSPIGRPDTSDEVETLPSWRGQYRKKRYPPA
jgi:hypothetical protein